MAKMSEEKLRELAEQRCQQAVDELFAGEYQVEPGKSETTWDPMLQRHVFRESLSVWRDFGEIEVVVAPDGRLQSFRDASRFLPDNPGAVPNLGDEQLMKIARTTGLLGPSAVLLRRETGANQMISAEVTQVEPGLPSDIAVTINPQIGQIAAFRVKGGAVK